MNPRAWLYRRLAWCALCAVTVAALAPTVSRALAQARGVVWVEICSAAGTEWVDLNGDGTPSSQSVLADEAHCDYCRLPHHSPGLLSASYRWYSPILGNHRLRVGSGATTVFKQGLRLAHRTRAPPVRS